MSSVALPAQAPSPFDGEKNGLIGTAPAWGSYLFNNYLIPSFSPSEWINSTPAPAQPPSAQTPLIDVAQQQLADYFENWSAVQGVPKSIPSLRIFNYQQSPMESEPQGQAQASQPPAPAGPSMSASQWDYPQPSPQAQFSLSSNYLYNPSISTSVLVSQSNSGSGTGRDTGSHSHSEDAVDAEMVHTPGSVSSLNSLPHDYPSKPGQKRRADSLETDDERDDHYHDHPDSHSEQDHDMPEGVERDGMIWGMKVEDYRALSARERKRVRNRISARTFRAKRKEHLTSLESTLNAKDHLIKLAYDETARLRREVAELKRRLAKYEQ